MFARFGPVSALWDHQNRTQHVHIINIRVARGELSGVQLPIIGVYRSGSLCVLCLCSLRVPGCLLKVPGGLLRVPGGLLRVPGCLLRVPGGLLMVPGGLLEVFWVFLGVSWGSPGSSKALPSGGPQKLSQVVQSEISRSKKCRTVVFRSLIGCWHTSKSDGQVRKRRPAQAWGVVPVNPGFETHLGHRALAEVK